MVAHEDRIAFNYLRSRSDVLPDHVSCAGLSGGGSIELGGVTTLNLATPVALANGGTGATTAAGASRKTICRRPFDTCAAKP